MHIFFPSKTRVMELSSKVIGASTTKDGYRPVQCDNELADDESLKVGVVPSRQSGRFNCFKNASKSRPLLTCFLSVSVIIISAVLFITSVQDLSRREMMDKAQDSELGASSTPELNVFEPFECGESPTLAIEKGCKFDPISFTWVPPACYDPGLQREFLSIADWSWYGDEAGQKPIPKEEILTGQHDYAFVSFRYHIVHCAFMWKKMHRSLMGRSASTEHSEGNHQGRSDRRGKDGDHHNGAHDILGAADENQHGHGHASPYIDGYIAQLHHTDHCVAQLLNNTQNLTDTNTVIYTKYPWCLPVEEGVKRTLSGEKGWYRMTEDLVKAWTLPTTEEVDSWQQRFSR